MAIPDISPSLIERCRLLELENRLLRAELELRGIPLPTRSLSESEESPSQSHETIGNQDQLAATTQGSSTRAAKSSPYARFSKAEKIALFRSVFRGRDDVYARRWENLTKNTSGYAPARPAPWHSETERSLATGYLDRQGRHHFPLTDDVIERHLLGEEVIGLYPLNRTGDCHLLVADFDGGAWQEDVQAFARTCKDANVPVLLEISRSGDGAHAWLFFDAPIAASDARRMAFGLLERTSSERRLLSLSSYDRLIPNQDTLPDGGFGSLVALPLQKQARERGGSLFVDAELCPFEDQWSALAEIVRVPKSTVHNLLLALPTNEFSRDIHEVCDAGDAPWRTSLPEPLSANSLPPVIRFTLADGLYIDRRGLPCALVRRFARLAAFVNPNWHERRRQRRSTWDTPMFVDFARNLPKHVGLPRGCLETAHDLALATCKAAGRPDIKVLIDDQRNTGQSIDIEFQGQLRDEQQIALDAMLAHDTGVLVAPPGFGKTITAAALLAARDTNTLIVVHRKDLLRQWQTRLLTFLGLDRNDIGVLGGGMKAKRTGRIDIVVVQALTRRKDIDIWLNGHGQWIIDECHHAGAASFESLLGRARPRYVLGLTATPKRRDGLEPIVYFQCGPIRHRASDSALKPSDLGVRFLQHNKVPDVPENAPIQNVLSAVANDEGRNRKIIEATLTSLETGRRVLLLSERKDHVLNLERALVNSGVEPIVLHGGLGRRQRAKALATLDQLDATSPRCLLATGRLIGEGFDHPPLDTLVLAMPLAWRGTLEQYVGRLHRPYPGKSDIRVIDIDDTAHLALISMRRKREAGYRALGYRRQREPELF